MITIASMSDATAITDEHLWVGSRLGPKHIGVDACWCNPACFMKARTVEINVSWS